MMNNKLKLAIGGIEAEINVNNEDLVDLYNDIASELNVEFNEIIVNYGNIDKTIILFYLMFKTNSMLQQPALIKGDIFLSTINIAKSAIQEKPNQTIKMEDNIKKTRQNLVVANVLLRTKLKQGGTSASYEENDEIKQMLNRFVSEVQSDIKSTLDKLMLF